MKVAAGSLTMPTLVIMFGNMRPGGQHQRQELSHQPRVGGRVTFTQCLYHFPGQQYLHFQPGGLPRLTSDSQGCPLGRDEGQQAGQQVVRHAVKLHMQI